MSLSSNGTGSTFQEIQLESPARRLMYISWAESCSRSDHTARELGGESHMVYLPFLGSHPLTILPKYIGQFLITSWLLLRHRPHAVVIMSPPIFAAFAPLIYHWLTGRPFALDNHTAAFKHPRFRRLQWLQAALERRAATNIVHNDHLRDIVVERGGGAVIVRDVPVVYEDGQHYEMSSGKNITVVCSFNPDEPIEMIFRAAEKLEDVQFYMTGNPKHLSNELKAAIPPNVQLTGFVSDHAYGSLLKRSHAVMSLTTRDHTMLRGAWEAVYQGTPVIVSDWPILREAFDQGAMHVDSSPESIANGIRQLLENHERFRNEAAIARKQRVENWNSVKQELLEKLLDH